MAKLSGNYGGGSKSSSKSSSSKSSSWTSGGKLNGSSSSYRPSSSSSSKGSTSVKLSGNYGGGSKSSGGSSDKYWSLGSGAKKVGSLGGGSSSSGSVYRPSSGSSNGYTAKSGVLGAYTGSGAGGSWTGNTLLKPKTGTANNGYTVKTGVLGASTTDQPNTKSNGVRIAATGGGPKNGKYLSAPDWEDTNSIKVPRRDAIPGFTGIYTPNSTGRIKGYSGGKLVNGIIRYPEGVNVDPTRAAKAQAFTDYSYGDTTSGRSDMAALYGDAYTKELQRLANLKVGEFAWGSPSGGTDYSVKSQVAGAYTDRPNYMSDYESALRAAEEASAEALRQQIEQGVNSIYGQKDGLKSTYEEAAQQAYIASMMGQKALPEQLAAQGLTGGATESANLALQTNYGNNLNNLTNTYNEGLTQVERDAANYRATGNISLAQNAADYQKQMANAALQAAQQQEQLRAQMALAEYNARIQAQQAEAQRQWQSQQTQAGWNWQAGQSQAEWERNKAMKEWEMQQDYDYWLKKLGAKSGYNAAPPVPDEENGPKGPTDYAALLSGLGGVAKGIGSVFNGMVTAPAKFAASALGVNGGAANSEFQRLTNLYNSGQMSYAEYIRHAKPYADQLGILIQR